jgi:hypothetical protein
VWGAVTHSPVELPVDVFIKRIDAFANEIATHYLPKLGPEPSPEDVIAVVDDYIYGTVAGHTLLHIYP